MFSCYVVMGVSGAGKSTVGAALAASLGARFIDADDLHPPENIRRMTSGQPLDDDMRWPWLNICGEALRETRQTQPVVLACSALKQTYRDALRKHVPDLKLICLTLPQDMAQSRVEMRHDHFMPPTLLKTQTAIFEPPAATENPLVIDATQPVAQIVDAIVAAG